MRDAPHSVNPLPELEAEPFKHDFFHTLRRIEAHFTQLPRLGQAKRPADEPLRLGQHPDLAFAPAPLHALKPSRAGAPPRLEVAFMGLFGPNGALPVHLTDYARERILHHGDETIARFADIFHHRMMLLFYRAWAQAQPTASLDRPDGDRFADYVGSMLGIGTESLQRRDEAPDHTKLYFAGHFSRQTRNADGLESIIGGFLGLPVRLETFVGHWMPLPDSERTRLQQGKSPSAQLGRGAVAGKQVWDRQHKFRLHIGPLHLHEFESLLPDRPALHAVRALVRQYIGHELSWDVRLILRKDEVPKTRPGAFGRLGWTTWSGPWRRDADADQFTFNPETSGRPHRAARAPVNHPEPAHA